MDPFCIMSDTQITSPTSFCIMSDTQITSPTWCHSVNVRFTDHKSNIILYNVRYIGHESNIASSCIMSDTDHESNIASSCIMSDTQITSPTWRHSVKYQIHRSRVQRGVIQYNVRYTWTRDLCIWYFTEWRHVGLVICVSDIILNDATLDSWSVYLTLYRMTPCWTCDLCIWHYKEWIHVGLVICVSDIIQNDDGLVICVSAIIQNDNMLDSWSVYLTLYRMMLDLWSVHLTLYRMDPCWTRDLCICHYTKWKHVGLVICVSDIIQNGFMLALWSCIWHYTEWCHVGLMICLSNIIQNDVTRSRVQHGIILYNVRYTDHESNMKPFCIMSDTQIMSPTWHHSVNVRYTDHESNMASFCKCQIHRSRVQHHSV